MTLGLSGMILGCVNVGEHASFSEKLKDNFLLTSAQPVSNNEIKCVSVDKTFSYKSGDVTITLPAGRYKASEKQDGGMFYYSPAKIKSSSFLTNNFYGLYIKDKANQGNLVELGGYRPFRGPVLPPVVFSHIKRLGHC